MKSKIDVEKTLQELASTLKPDEIISVTKGDFTFHLFNRGDDYVVGKTRGNQPMGSRQMDKLDDALEILLTGIKTGHLPKGES